MLISFPDWLILSLAAIGWLFLVALTGMGGLLVLVTAVPPAEWNQLYDDADICAALPIVAVVGWRRVDWWRITGRKDRPTRTPPWVPWRADGVVAS